MAIDCEIDVTGCIIFYVLCCFFIFGVGSCVKKDQEYTNNLYEMNHKLKMKELELKIEIEKNKKSIEKDLTKEV